MATATEIRKGSVLVLDGELFVCSDFHHITPGNKRGHVQTKIKSLKSGQIVNKRFSATERVEFAFLDKRACEYLYQDGGHYVFMDGGKAISPRQTHPADHAPRWRIQRG